MKLVAVIAAVLVGVLAGCGDSGPTAEEKREAAEKREQAVERKAELLATERAAECSEQLGDFLESLEELEARLEVGVNYTDYFTELGDIQVTYNRLPIDDLHPRCLGRVGVPSEKAFQAYVDAGGVWEECLDTLSCDEDGIDPAVQDAWVTASNRLEQAATIGMVEVGAVAVGDREAAEKFIRAGSE